MEHTAKYQLSAGWVILLAGLVICVTLLIPPVAQDPAYHTFADRRMLYGIPNFWNVVSSTPFMITGVWGLVLLQRHRDPGVLPGLRQAYVVFFAGVLLTGFGSAWYHLDPANESLFWDRLPMTLAFMAFFCIVVGEYLSPRAGRWMLWPLVIAGVLAIVYWQFGESRGRGDLRPYALVQFLPVLLIPLILLVFRPRLDGAGYLWAMLVAYLFAKVAEYLDAEIYSSLGVISGHSLKHVLAALGTGFICLGVYRRTPDQGVHPPV
jgi:hypothetical protein